MVANFLIKRLDLLLLILNFNDMYENNASLFLNFDLSLISPYVCKWRSIGTDARGEGLRIMSEDSSLKNSNSFYIPYLQYTEDLGYIYQRDSSIFYDKHIPKNIEQMSYDSSNGSEVSNIGITEKDSILFKKNKTLNELIEFYKGDCEFPNYSSLDVDYYRCELVYGDEVTSFTFGDEQNLVILDETEVIF